MKVFIETYGCSANVNDSEIMAGLLNKSGHQIVAVAEDADAVIVNTCTVKGPTEDKIRSRIRQLLQLQSEGSGNSEEGNGKAKRLVVAGCMAEAQTDSVQKLAPLAAVIGTHKINEIVEVVEGKKQVAVGSSSIDKASLPKLNVNSLVSIIQINSGCMGACSFCITKAARGSTFSYPIGTIRNSVEEAVKGGCMEIWLTSQDTGTYGLDRRGLIRGTPLLPQLLQNICTVDGDFFVRVGMMNPTLANHLLQQLVEAFKSDKVFKFLHIPLQAGSNSVLAAMKRGYKVETFKRIIAEFRKHLPQLTIATDVICGFPSETNEDFDETLTVVEETKPDVVNVSRFWPRPGTAASGMKRLPDGIVMERSRKLHALAKMIALERNLEWVGWKGRAIVDEKGKEPGTFMARNFAYKPVVVSSREDLLGKTVEVEIVDASVTHLKGSVD